MPQKVRIALDAMGGDHGAAVVVPGAELSLTRHSDIEFLLFGDRAAIEPLLATRPALKAASRLIHTDVAIKMDDKPSQALRKGRWKSSMWLAIDAVKKHEADVIISAGNTGSAMASALLGIERPTVGLLNIGVEEAKGLEPVRDAGKILREGRWSNFRYAGFVEGDDIGKGTVDVVVTEGFAGNIALKAAEGTARQLAHYLNQELSRSLISKLGYLLARRAFRALSSKMDPRKANGGIFLGLNGIVIKSHGGTDAEGFAYAVDQGYDMVRHELLAKIGETLAPSPDPEVAPRLAGGAAS